MGYKSIDVLCLACESQHIQLEDVPYGTSLPDVVTCDKCGATDAKRLISATVHKAHVQEAIHGTVINGKMVSRETGAGAAQEQARLNKRLKEARKARDNDTARDVQRELTAKVAENKKKLNGG
jgi:hypothetical protein